MTKIINQKTKTQRHKYRGGCRGSEGQRGKRTEKQGRRNGKKGDIKTVRYREKETDRQKLENRGRGERQSNTKT